MANDQPKGVCISVDALQALVECADRYIDDLESGLADGTYEEEGDLEDVCAAVSEAEGALKARRDYTSYLSELPLTEALWWFIENVSDDDPLRADYFFSLRERVREESEAAHA